mgnify:CR=1 FL=1
MLLSFDVGVKNLSYVILDGNKIIDWQILNVETKKGQTQTETLVYTLDDYLKLFNKCDEVIIEKQPSRNNKMRIIEGLLNAYFVIKGKCEKKSNIKKVFSYSAKHKLNEYIKKIPGFNGKSGYTARKKLSVEITAKFIENIEQKKKFIEQFKASKKKDDLADCLLQGLKYLDIEVLGDDEMKEIVSNMTIKTKTSVPARKPTDKQMKSKTFSKSNLKWYINDYKTNNPNVSNCDLNTYLKSTSKLQKSCLLHYKSIDECITCLS